MVDVDSLLILFGSAFGSLVLLAIVAGVAIEIYRRYYMPEENEFTDPQNNV